MFVNLVIYVGIFFVILNFDWLLRRRKNPALAVPSMAQLVYLPLSLGLALALVHSYLRVMFVYKFILFSVALYWFFSVFLKK